MAAAAREAGVPVVTGDTKVVEQGKGDGVFIATTGVGVVPQQRSISGATPRPGDAVLVSGTIGDHGVAVLSQRESLEFETTIESDTAALHTLVARLLAAVPEGSVRTLRDPTRGGLATTLNEIAKQSGVGMLLEEAAIPIKPQVNAACELLGLDPLYIANEGKCIVVCDAAVAEGALEALRSPPAGREAARIAPSPTTRSASCRWPRPSAAGAWSTGSPASRCRASAERRPPAHAARRLPQDRGRPRRDPQPRARPRCAHTRPADPDQRRADGGRTRRTRRDSTRPSRWCGSSAPG